MDDTTPDRAWDPVHQMWVRTPREGRGATDDPDFGGAFTELHPGPPRMFSASEFARRPITKRGWLAEGMIPAAQVTSADGAGGGGKSTVFGLQLTLCAVTGRAWLGMPVMRGPAIYVAAEDDVDEIQRRLDAACVHYRVSFEDVADLHLWPLADEDPALVIGGRDDTVEPTARWAQLVAGVERIKPVVLVLDSRADMFGGNEISRAQARGFIGLLRKLAIKHSVAVVLLGHPSLSGLSSGSGSSGSTHWRNAVRSGLHLKRPDGDDPDPDVRILEVVKANYAAAGRALTLRWSAGVFDLEEGPPRPASREEAAADVERTFLRLLQQYDAQGRDVGDKPSASYAPTVFARDPAAAGITRKGFEGAMNRLFSAGRIRVDHVGKPSNPTRKIVVCA